MAFFACFIAAEPLAADPPPTVATLENIVREWADVRIRVATEKNAWREKEAALRTELDLLKTEAQTLQKAIDEDSRFQSSADKEQIRLIERRQRLQSVVDALPALLDRAEVRLAQFRPFVPPSLMPSIEKAFHELPASPADASAISVSRRLQVVMALYTQIETMQNSIHVTREVLSMPSQSRQEMDVLYVGLARAFAISPDDRIAAVGVPSPSGWQWSPRPDASANIRQAIRMFNREHVAGLVSLPLQPMVKNAKQPDAAPVSPNSQ